MSGGPEVVLFAGPEGELERALALQERVHASGRCRVCPPMDLRVTAALLAEAAALVSNDTGLMHLAAAVGTPTVGLFGPTSPRLYLPRGEEWALERHRRGGRGNSWSEAVEPRGPLAACPLRTPAGWGPPRCVMQGRCEQGVRSCIDAIEPADVVLALQAILSDGWPTEPATTRERPGKRC